MEVKSEIEIQREDVANVPYRQAISCMIYLVVGTRPDISFAIGKLSRFREGVLFHTHPTPIAAGRE